jgi:hypothetical protein
MKHVILPLHDIQELIFKPKELRNHQNEGCSSSFFPCSEAKFPLGNRRPFFREARVAGQPVGIPGSVSGDQCQLDGSPKVGA